MPYLRPEEVLERFSGFTLSTLRPAVPEEEAFVRGQAGSMASTLRFLAGELERREAAAADQRDRLETALAETAAVLQERGAGAEEALAAVEDARARTAAVDPETPVRERETALLEAAEEALAAVDGLDPETARAARRPLYGFLDARVAGQLRMLGGQPRPETVASAADREGPE